jgi:hypothetical protein
MAAEVLPDVYLELPNSSWPPASAITPAGVAEVTAWSVDREIVGKVLPGQVRARSGLSIGSASATIRQPSGKPMTPWGRGDRQIVTSGAANLYATDGDPLADERRNLGSWQVDPAQGSLLSPTVPVELIESQYAGRTQLHLLPPNDGDWCDPAWVVSVLAAQAGFHAVPPPVPSAVFAASMSGSLWPERGIINSYYSPSEWSRATGPLTPVGGLAGIDFAPQADVLSIGGVSAFVTFNVLGTATVQLGYPLVETRPAIQIRPGGILAARATEAAPWVTVDYEAGLSPAHPLRVQVEVQRDGEPGAWTQFRARARSGPDAPWSPWATSNVASNHQTMNWLQLEVPATSAIAAMQISTDADPALWAPATADIDALGGKMTVPWLPGTMDAWTGIQEICATYCGATWIDNDGILKTRDRRYLAGNSAHVETLDIDTMVEDLGWSTDPADSADRLVVTYNPSDVERYAGDGESFGPIIWEAPDVLELLPHQSIEVVADLEFYANAITQWLPVWDLGAYTASSWSAFDNREGSGDHAADEALVITTRQISTGRMIITVRNTTAGTLYTVDGTGAPCLILRGYKVARQANQATITRGLADSEARNELTVDLGRYVQTPEDANTLADFIWARVSQPMWKATAVRVTLDWTRDIGRIVLLAHPDSDLQVKALVVGLHMTGVDGSVEQLLDLVILPPTWFDFDQAWAGETWAGFDGTWAGANWSAFDNDPLKTA